LLVQTAGIDRIQAAPHAISGRFEGIDRAVFGLVAEHAAAFFASYVFEKYLLPAFIAMECFHEARGLVGRLIVNDRSAFVLIVPFGGDDGATGLI
jgi:hypothetical protein